MLSFVSLISHDHEYLIESIKSYYSIADEIILGMDVDNISWSQNKVVVSDVSLKSIEMLDIDGKVRIIKDNFHSQPTPMQNETDERNRLSELCKDGNWIVQIDADECIIDSKEFKDQIEVSDPNKLIQCIWISLFKHIKNSTYLRIDRYDEYFPVATKLRSRYISGRYTDQQPYNLDIEVLHYSWARSSENQVYDKLKNFGHSNDFDIEFWFNMWKNINENNYSNYYNFHPLSAALWPALVPIDLASYTEHYMEEKSIFNEVDKWAGWFSKDELKTTLRYVMSTKNLHGEILEIGSYCGKTSSALSLAAKRQGKSSFSIDHFVGSVENQQERDNDQFGFIHGSTFTSFMNNLKNVGLYDNVNILANISDSVAKWWNLPIKFILIDGDHRHDQPLADYNNYKMFIVKGGYVAFHDSHFPDVIRAIEQAQRDGFKIHGQVNTLLFLRRE